MLSAKAMTTDLADTLDRRTAVATFDRNLVVTAGAGTGKTTLLIDRIVHLLLRNPDPIQMTDIVALTFTNKAANEIKQRLRDRLQGYSGADPRLEPVQEEQKKLQQQIESLMDTYRVSKDELDRRVQEALRNLERAEIGTIHSFAATLLRLFPLEAGVDPQFHEDDGKQFRRLFDQQWHLWLDQELALESPRAGEWRKVLKHLTLEQIKDLAGSLCSESVQLERVQATRSGDAALGAWLRSMLASAASLSERHPEDRNNEKLVRAAHSVIQAFIDGGDATGTALAGQRACLLEHSINRDTKGWTEADIKQAHSLVSAAKGLCRVDPALTHLIWKLLAPYAARFREIFVHEGFISFDGLLIRARNLVRDHLRVREELKRQYRTFLIDEFQDTDPIQYEILLYLAEQPGSTATNWRKVKLTAGKVFVVGDPKQSIYAFRRADIEAYLEVVEKIIKAQNGIECHLRTNFRSDRAIIDVVNGVFSSLIQPQPGMQPRYIGIQPAPGRDSPPLVDSGKPLPATLVRKIIAPDGDVSAETARRLEGESLADWLHDQVLNNASFVNARGERVLAQPKDVAILFRKLTDIHDYLEPLRRRGIRYVVEGERHFYAAKEIIDAVNLLRAIENPNDRLALVGVLRSPIGGLTDQSIYDLHCDNLLDYRLSQQLGGKDYPPTLPQLYGALAKLHADCRRLPVGAAVSRILETLPLRLLAACYFHGEQAVANIDKLRRHAEILGREDSAMTFKAAIRQLQQRVLDVEEEGESVLAEEDVDAVRIMSVHKSKGLEFPIVVLAGCHAGINGQQRRPAEALFDWSSGLTGIRVGSFTDLAGVYIAEKNRLRAEEEAKRVLYVAMTRAREHLIISSGPSARKFTGNFLGMLDEAAQDQIGRATRSTNVEIGPGKLAVELVEANLTAPGAGASRKKPRHGKRNWQDYMEVWRRRERNYQAALQSATFVTPTSLKRQEQEVTEGAVTTQAVTKERTPAMLVGELAHRFLEHWDFAGDRNLLRHQLGAFLSASVPAEYNQDANRIGEELRAILDRFINSGIYAELRKARILGREVPLLMPWNGQIMEGVIDLIYERNGLLYLADYKTDRIEAKDLRLGAERYRRQAEIYSEAARRSLKREVAAFKLIFLRLGETVEVDFHPDKELWLF
jgi:ATP-dependent helicase/nuclease subunit A